MKKMCNNAFNGRGLVGGAERVMVVMEMLVMLNALWVGSIVIDLNVWL